ncbi:MAG: TolC family protein [Chlorobium sp.]
MQCLSLLTRPLFGFGPSGRKLLLVLSVFACLVFFPQPSFAALSLMEAVRTALDHAPGVLTQRESLLISESDVLGARSAFDPHASLSFGYRKDALALGDIKTATTILSTSMLTPFGLTVTPQVSVVGSTPSNTLSSSEASAGVTFTLPLMEGLGDNISRTALSASRKRYKAESLTLQHTAGRTVYQVAESYWNYLYAYRTLKLNQQLSQSAQESYKATRALAGAGEVAVVRADQAQAYLQQAQASEINAVQALGQSWNTLLLSMGSDTVGRESPEEPLDFFPVPDGDVSLLLAEDGALKAKAFASRADLQALKLQGDAAADILLGSRNRMKPKVDLELWAGYNGLQDGATFMNNLSSLSTGIPGVNISATLRYSLDAGNHSDEAYYINSRSQVEIAAINRQELGRSIESSVALAVASVKNSAAIYRLSKESARSYRLLNTAELKKYRMGMSDLFKVQSVLNDLASAEKQLLAAEKAYASSLLTLRYEVASLLRVKEGSFTVEMNDLVTIPAFDNALYKP